MKIQPTLIIAFFILSACNLFAQPGSLDETFGNSGKVSTQLYPGSSEIGYDIGIQPDGKIIAKCLFYNEEQFMLLRYNFNGEMDSTFGDQGKVLLDWIYSFVPIHSLLVDSLGKIINLSGKYGGTYGNLHFILNKFDSEGKPDSTFGVNGNFEYSAMPEYHEAFLLKARNDGKLLVAGEKSEANDIFISRILPEGSPDLTFGQNGSIIITDLPNESRLNTIEIQADNKILIAGTYMYYYQRNVYCMRLNENGSIDSTFADNGFLYLDFDQERTNYVNLAFQNDSTFLISCTSFSSDSDFAIARYSVEGTLDITFADNGKLLLDLNDSGQVDQCLNMCVQSDGRILLTGSAYYTYSTRYDFALVQLEPDGTPDIGFGDQGILQIDFSTMSDEAFKSVFQNDNRIVTIGSCQTYSSYDIGLCRILTDLYLKSEDFNMSPNNILVYPNPVYQTCELRYEISSNSNIQIQLFSLDGRLVKQFAGYENGGTGVYTRMLDLSDVPAGNYIIRLITEQGEASVKIIKN